MAAAAAPPSKQHPDCDFLFKLILIGDSGVGKSCLLQRFCSDTGQSSEFNETHVSTIGVDFRFRFVNIDKKVVKLQIWDTAGQEKFRTITNAYYRGADGVILVYDVTNAESFEHVEEWLADVERYAGETISKLLVGNKSDLKDEKQITTEEALKKSETMNMPFVETSAKDGEGVDSAFVQLTTLLIRKAGQQPIEKPEPTKPVVPITPIPETNKPQKESCDC